MRRTKFQGIVKQVWARDPDRVYLAQFGRDAVEPVALRLYASRAACGIMRCTMAGALGVHPSTVTRWETGVFHTISMAHLVKWALVCNVPTDWLVNGGPMPDVRVRRLCRDYQAAYKTLLEPLPDRLHIVSTMEQYRKFRVKSLPEE